MRWRLLSFEVPRVELLRRLAARNREEHANALTVTERDLSDFEARFDPPYGEGEELIPAAGIRRILNEGTTQGIGDPALMATAMIASVDQEPAPRRLVLGSDAFQGISNALSTRLADVESQRESAGATDSPLEGVASGGVGDLRN